MPSAKPFVPPARPTFPSDEAVAEEQRQPADPGGRQAEGDGVAEAVDQPACVHGGGVSHRRPWKPVMLATALAVAGVVLWQGANSSTASWFGHQVSHGPRHGNEVALTFDDGPNSTATVPILDLLDARGVQGTFFVVGRAVAARPDLAREIVRRGHLVGNHSWRHDSKAWLDPRYPELGRTQRAIDADLGVCPAFYRAPHGQHTPLLARVVHRHGMTMIGWDVSAGDWKARDPRHLADRIVAKARPGSIIDLHDGLDGRVDADRRILVAALPRILDGLASKGLDTVRLDELIARPGYLGRC